MDDDDEPTIVIHVTGGRGSLLLNERVVAYFQTPEDARMFADALTQLSENGGVAFDTRS